MKRYNPKEIEPKWQQEWSHKKIYKAVDFDNSRPKYVMLTEFPYPSGDGLHLGHVREYALGDIMARFKRMTGHNVLYPMAYDAFGLPTENYAIKNKIAPQVATEKNINNFQKQFDSLGFSFDWDRSFSTTDPSYYKWTQWLFLQFYKAGLAYQAETTINWCPHCKTGLANEEVVNGRHERCDNLVEKKHLKQWLLKITEYADRLIDGLDEVDYPKQIADQQINWIGRSKGAEVDFTISENDTITVFTTRPDTLFGATFLVLAPEHPLVSKITTASQKSAVNSYVKTVQSKSEIDRQDTNREKTGVFTGAYAVNPANNQKIPIWIADYVLASYGSGAIMAVPAHDERDNAFAVKYNLPIKVVIARDFGEPLENCQPVSGVNVIGYDPEAKLFMGLHNNNTNQPWLVGGGLESGESFEQAAQRELIEESGYKQIKKLIQLGEENFSYYYNDNKKCNRRATTVNFLAIISKDENNQPQNEKHEDFSVVWKTMAELRSDIKKTSGGVEHWLYGLDCAAKAAEAYDLGQDYQPEVYSGEGVLINSAKYDGQKSHEVREQIVEDLRQQGKARAKVTYKLRDWIFSRQHYWGEPIPMIHCPQCGVVAVPEEQLPVELPPVEHYEPTDTGQSPLALIDWWVNVDCPQCGGPAKRETDTMPNWAGSSWYYLRYYDAHNDKAFADPKKLKYWGMVDIYLGGMEHTTLHLLYSRFWHQFLYDQKLVPTPEPYYSRRGQGIILASDGNKMSKSKGNVVNPTEIIEAGYGADALRLAIAFIAPYDQTTPWNPEGVAGTHRFVSRIWTLIQEFIEASPQIKPETEVNRELLVALHKTIYKVSKDLLHMNFNTAVSSLMELVNALYKIKARDNYSSLEWAEVLRGLLRLTAPFAPYVTEDLWQQLNQTGSIHLAAWPDYDEEYLTNDTMKIVVQVNGKMRATIVIGNNATEPEVVAAAEGDPKVLHHIGGKKIVKKIYVPSRLVNFVVQ